VFAFITPEAFRRLLPRFKMLKSGSRLITYMFPLLEDGDFEEKIEYVSSKDTIYIYTKV
jgi:hypothetical protein